MNKNLRIGLGVVIALLLIITSMVFLALRSPTVAGAVVFEEGQVLVNDAPVYSGTSLREGDTVATGESAATVVVHDSVLVALQPNSKLLVRDLGKSVPVLEWLAGEAHVSFAHTTSVEEFRLIKGEHVIRASGTGFSVDAVRTMLLEGEVTIEAFGKVVKMAQGYSLVFSSEDLTVVPWGAEERAIVDSIKEELVSTLEKQRMREIQKHRAVVLAAEELTGMSRDELYSELERIDRDSSFSVDELVARSPLKGAAIDKVAGYTKELQKLHAAHH